MVAMGPLLPPGVYGCYGTVGGNELVQLEAAPLVGRRGGRFLLVAGC